MTSPFAYLLLAGTTIASPACRSLELLNTGAICTNPSLQTCLAFYPDVYIRADSSPLPDACPSIDPSPTFTTNYRSTPQIVWSCLAIIFASTWVCVHPNVTGYNTTTKQRLWKRVKLFGWAVFAPELLAAFAWFQWRGCRILHEHFRDRALELGISLKLEPTPRERETQADGAAVRVTEGQGSQTGAGKGEDGQPLLREEGETKEAADPAAGFLAFFKTPIRSLKKALSLYEVDPAETAWTLTHAHFVQMGGIAFKDSKSGEIGFKEPRISGPFPDDLWQEKEVKEFFAGRYSEDFILDKSKSSAFAKLVVVMQVLWFVTQVGARFTQDLPTTHLEVVCLAFTVFNIGMYVCWWDKPLDVEHPLEVSGIPGAGRELGRDRDDWMEALSGGLDLLPVGEWVYSPETRLYPSFYCVENIEDHSPLDQYFSGNGGGVLGAKFTFALSFTSASFGAMHVLGWNLHSPSPAEHVIWQVSCLVLMCYPIFPLVVGPLEKFIRYRVYGYRPGWEEATIWTYILGAISGVGAVAYIIARFLLLVLPFVELRSLPPLAHQTVSWANFLPHV